MKTVEKSHILEKNKVMSPKEEEQKRSSRRHFLKKSVYSAPLLIAMGQLVKPTNAQADNSVPPPPPIW